MKLLDQFRIKEFVEQVKIALAQEDESILAVSYGAGSWAWAHMIRPSGMDWVEFGFYNEVVGAELVKRGILKQATRFPSYMRVSRKWYNENRKE